MPRDAAPEEMPDLKLGPLFSASGKVAVVTGGGSGLGKMMSAALVQNGCRVYIASRKLDELQRVAKSLNETAPEGPFEAGTFCIPIQADVGTKAGCDALAAEIKKYETQLDILINNSGLSWGGKIDDFPEEKGWNKVFDLNVKSQFYLTVALLPLLEKGKSNVRHASVLNIASVAAYTPAASSPLSGPGNGTYSYQPSKAASVHLTRMMAHELADKFVLVNALCPGVFPSRMTSWSLDQSRDVLEDVQPTGRLGTPEDIGGTVLFLTSRAGAHITGAAIPIDGGQMLQFVPKL
ncbi:hypothetical protein MPSI1_000537 [Malassezia psittaci]|uniref:Rhamnolipids biosynthesis 3-oxoacyl-[acyl-carrier-protein] reductase n=1 Tax=Malassezia psittaci TaxID=1821823 RepID=A0AAF0F6S9_9BASI|nr:hypothetical protein MPSI1_000537 [Malassezia psittaci]